MGKFKPKVKKPKPAPPPPVEDTAEGDEAAARLRSAERRRAGRRATIFSDIEEEEAQLARVRRPVARAAKALFGGG